MSYPIDPEIARLAAQTANKLFGQWMPERWLNLFIDAYDDMSVCRAAEPAPIGAPSADPQLDAEVDAVRTEMARP